MSWFSKDAKNQGDPVENEADAKQVEINWEWLQKNGVKKEQAPYTQLPLNYEEYDEKGNSIQK